MSIPLTRSFPFLRVPATLRDAGSKCRAIGADRTEKAQGSAPPPSRREWIGPPPVAAREGRTVGSQDNPQQRSAEVACLVPYFAPRDR